MTKQNIKPKLLRLICVERERVLGLSPYRGLHDDANEWGLRWTAIRDLKSGLGVRIDRCWIGNSPAERQARRRGLLALEAAGLVALSSANGSHATHAALIDPDDADEDYTASPLPRSE